MSFLSRTGLMTQEDKCLLEERMNAMERQLQILTKTMSELADHVASLCATREKSFETFTEEMHREAVRSAERSERLLSTVQEGNMFARQSKEEIVPEFRRWESILTEYKQYVGTEIEEAAAKIMKGNANLAGRVDMLQEAAHTRHVEWKRKEEETFARQEQVRGDLRQQRETLSQLAEQVVSLHSAQESGIERFAEALNNEAMRSTGRSGRLLAVMQEGRDLAKKNRDEIMRGLHILGNMLTEQKKYIDSEVQGVVVKVAEGNENLAGRLNVLQESSQMKHMELERVLEESVAFQKQMQKNSLEQGENLQKNIDVVREFVEHLSASHVEKHDLEILASYLRLLIANQLMDQAEELLDEEKLSTV